MKGADVRVLRREGAEKYMEDSLYCLKNNAKDDGNCQGLSALAEG